MIAPRTGEIGHQRHRGDAVFRQPVSGLSHILGIGGDEGDARGFFPARNFQSFRQRSGIKRRHLDDTDGRALQMRAAGGSPHFGAQGRHEGIVIAGQDEDHRVIAALG
ncbi:hypothetical protein D3C72_1988380 [compost metagenome]